MVLCTEPQKGRIIQILRVWAQNGPFSSWIGGDLEVFPTEEILKAAGEVAEKP